MKPRLVALHGFLGCGADWNAVRKAVRRDFDWVCPDIFARRAEDWRSAREFSGKAWLVGYSFGGRMALRWMAEDPGRWHGALLLSTNPGNFQTEDERRERRRTDAAWARAFRVEPWEDLMRRWNNQPVLAAGATPLREEALYDREKLALAFEDYSTADQQADVSELSKPLIWMAGERDAKFVRLLHSMRDANFPGAFRIVGDAGHRLLHDAPEIVAEELDSLTESP